MKRAPAGKADAASHARRHEARVDGQIMLMVHTVLLAHTQLV